jgi:hypothetical protein
LFSDACPTLVSAIHTPMMEDTMRRIAFSMLLTLVIGWTMVAWATEPNVLAIIQKYEKAFNNDDLSAGCQL